MLVGSVDLSAHPYRLRSAEEPRDLADALAAKLADPVDGAQVPFAATGGRPGRAHRPAPRRGARRAGARARLLRRDQRDHQRGLRRAQGQRHRGPSSAPRRRTARRRPRGEQSIELGAILDGQDRKVGTFRVPLATLNRHAFVTGATGSGKSQTVRHMLEQLTGAGIPWLAIEPVKSEYAAMAGRIAGAGQVTVINPSDPAAVPLSVNPLEPEPGYPVQAHIDMVRALFLAAFEAREPFPQIISQALQRAYENCGWDPVTGAGRPGAPAASGDPHPGPAAARGARGDRGRRLRAGAAGRRPRLRRRAAALAADRLGRPVLRGRAPGRHRRAAAPPRGAGDRGRRQRRGQGVPDRHADHQARRAPEAARPHRARRAASRT